MNTISRKQKPFELVISLKCSTVSPTGSLELIINTDKYWSKYLENCTCPKGRQAKTSVLLTAPLLVHNH